MIDKSYNLSNIVPEYKIEDNIMEFFNSEAENIKYKEIYTHLRGYTSNILPYIKENYQEIVKKNYGHYRTSPYVQKQIRFIDPHEIPRLDQLPQFQYELDKMSQEAKTRLNGNFYDKAFFLT